MADFGRFSFVVFFSVFSLVSVGCSTDSSSKFSNLFGKKSKNGSGDSQISQDSGALSLTAGDGMLNHPSEMLEIMVTDSNGKKFSAVLKPGQNRTTLSGLALGKATAQATLKKEGQVVKSGTGSAEISSHKPAYLALHLRTVGGDGSIVIDVIDHDQDPICKLSEEQVASAGATSSDVPESFHVSHCKPLPPAPVPPCFIKADSESTAPDTPSLGIPELYDCGNNPSNPPKSFFNLSLPAGNWKATFLDKPGSLGSNHSKSRRMEIEFNPKASDNQMSPAVQSLRISQSLCGFASEPCVTQQVTLLDVNQQEKVVAILNQIRKPDHNLMLPCPEKAGTLTIEYKSVVFEEQKNCSVSNHFEQETLLLAWKSLESFLN